MKAFLLLSAALVLGAGVASGQSPVPLASDTSLREPQPHIVLPPGVDSVRPPVTAGERFARGAVIGAAVGATLSSQHAECAPSSSASASGLIGGLWGGLRSMLRWGSPAETSGSVISTRPGPSQPGPFPFDGEECGNLRQPSVQR